MKMAEVARVYARPESVEEALSLLAAERWAILAGGTDFFPALGERAVDGPVLDITGIGALRGIRRDATGWRIGALSTWTDVIRAALPPAFDALKQAAREVGSVQIQNRATVAGNLCNASPAADGVPPLMVLDAAVELTSPRGTRQLRLESFITGNRSVTRAPDEIVTAVIVPAGAAAGRSAFVKLGIRRYLVISIAMVAARIDAQADGTIARAAISVGACSAVAKRLPDLERALIGAPAAAAAGIVTPSHLGDLVPIDDIRAPAGYRTDAALELVRRALDACHAMETTS